MNDEKEYDLKLTLSAQFATKALRSVNFPWTFQYNFQPAHYPFDMLEKDETHFEGDEAGSSISDDILAEHLQQQFESDQDGRISTFGNSSQPNSQADTDAETAGDSRYNIDFYSVSLVVPEEPKIILGNPVRIEDLTVRIKAQFKASIRVFGKEYATHKSTPWVTLCGRSATLKLYSQGATILGGLTLNDIDLIAKVKIFKWHYNCHLGLTKLINKQLAKRDPFELLDLSTFQKSLTPEAESLKVDYIEFDETTDQLLLKLFIQDPLPKKKDDHQ